MSFLTRVPAPCPMTASRLADSVRWYPLAGLFIGIVGALPLLGGFFSGSPQVQGWLYAGLSLWITRGLHWDGLADVLDAAGSGASGERFRQILKDSRLGALGALGLTFGLLGLVILAGEVCARSDRPAIALILAPTVGRCVPALLLCCVPVNRTSTLAHLIAPGVNFRVGLLHALLAVCCTALLLGGAALFTLAAALACCLIPLIRLARREDGLNGDFLGCGILSGELAVLLAALV